MHPPATLTRTGRLLVLAGVCFARLTCAFLLFAPDTRKLSLGE